MERLSTTHVSKLIQNSRVYGETLDNTLCVQTCTKLTCIWRDSRQHIMCPNLFRAHVYMEGLSTTHYVSKLIQSSRVYEGTLDNTLCVQTCTELTCIWRDSRQHIMCPNLYRAHVYMERLSTTHVSKLVQSSRVYGGTLDNTLCSQTCTKLTCIWRDSRQHIMCPNLYRAHVYIERLSTTYYVAKLVQSSHVYGGTLDNTCVQTCTKLTCIWRDSRQHIVCLNLYRAHVYMEGLSTTHYVSKLIESSRVYEGTLDNTVCVQTCTELTCIWRDSRQHIMCPNLYRVHVYMEGLSAAHYVSKLIQSSCVYGGTLDNTCVQTYSELTRI